MTPLPIRVIPIALFALAGCSPAASPPPQPVAVIPTNVSVAPPPGAQAARRPATLPANPAVAVAFDTSQASLAIAAIASHAAPDLAAEIHRWAGLAASDQAPNALADAWGLDPGAPLVMAAAPLDDSGRAILKAAKTALKASSEDGGATHGPARPIEEAMWANRGILSHYRVLASVRDADRFIAALDATLARVEFKRLESSPDADAVFAKRQRVVVVKRESGRVVVDVVLVVGDVPAARVMAGIALSSLRARADRDGSSPPSLDGRLARVVYSPEAASEVGLAEAMAGIHDAVRRFDEQTRDRLWERGLADFVAIEALTRTDRGTFFDSVDLSLDLGGGAPRLTSKAGFGPGIPAIPPSAWTPSRSVDFPGALARFDIATAAMKSIVAPGDASDGLAAASAFESLYRNAGWGGWPGAIPFAPIAATRVPLGWYAGVGPRAMLRFERFGWANPAFGAPDVFWGLLPPGTKSEEIACAVDESGPGCRGPRRISPTTFSHVAGAWVRVIKLGDRFVVLASSDKKALGALSPALTPTPVPALRGVISEGTLRQVLGDWGFDSAGARVTAAVSLDGTTLLSTVQLEPKR